jgi:hypothetical protein
MGRFGCIGLTIALTAIPAAMPGQAAPLRLRMQAIRDPMVNNEEAFRLLVPENWRVEGGIVWRPELSNLAYLQMRLSDPQGTRALEVFPTIPFTWNERGYFGFPPGSLYLGSYVVAPLAPDDFVRQVLLPQVRGRVSPKVIRSEPLPDLARQVAATVQEAGAMKQVAASRTRIEYQEGARTIEEDIYCVNVYTQTYVLPGVTYWGAERVFGFRAEKGQLDRQAPLLQAISASVRVNPGWFSRVLQVREAWVQNQMNAIRSAGELSRYLARTSDEMSAAQQQAWESRRASEDRSAEAFIQYIRGVETYRDPYADRDVQLPTGYQDVWASRDGQYILANDPNFNPNVSATGTWQRIDPSHQ